LFEDTPIFEEPLPQYSDKKSQNSWRCVANVVLSPFGKLKKYIRHIVIVFIMLRMP
jgi:hypothetical protein